MEQRALPVELYGERTCLQQQTRTKGKLQPDGTALCDLMACAYPELKVKSKEYANKKERLQRTLDEGRNWSTAQGRYPSGLWMFPPNMLERE